MIAVAKNGRVAALLLKNGRRRGPKPQKVQEESAMAYSHMLVGASTGPKDLVIRRIAPADLFDALARGIDDFVAMPSHAVFLCVIYPLLGIALIAMTLGNSTSHAFDVLHAPSLGAIVALGLLLMAIFLIWLAVADAIYIAYFGYHGPASIGQVISDVFYTRAGWMLIVVGSGVGFLFAVLVLTISAISFPLLLDRDVGAAVAVLTSIRVVAKNPLTMALWGFIVAALLVLGSIPFFLGLTVVMPVLGHATWHLYRRVVEPDANPHEDYKPRERAPRSAADFPAALFPTRR